MSAVAAARPEAALPPGSTLSPKRQTARWVVQPLAFLQELRAEHGDLFTVRMLDEQPWVMVSEPELIKQVFAAPADVLHAGEGKAVLEPMLGSSSLLLLDGDAHMSQRKLLLPPFRGRHVARYEAAIRAVAEEGVASWAATRSAGPAWPAMQAIALEVILRTVFGMAEGERLDALRAALGESRSRATRARDRRRASAPRSGASTSSSTPRWGAHAGIPAWASATTSLRCCSRPATSRTGRRCRTARSATS